MAAATSEASLRVDRAKLNPRFEGYKVRLSLGRICLSALPAALTRSHPRLCPLCRHSCGRGQRQTWPRSARREAHASAAVAYRGGLSLPGWRIRRRSWRLPCRGPYCSKR